MRGLGRLGLGLLGLGFALGLGGCDRDAIPTDSDQTGATGRVESIPGDGERDVALGRWLMLRFPDRIRLSNVDGIRLDCEGVRHPVDVFRASGGRVVLRPERPLPPAADCAIRWRVGDRSGSIAFGSRAPEPHEPPVPDLHVIYERRNPEELAPVPDDFWTRSDPTTATGRRLELPRGGEGDLARMIDGLRPELEGLDGWSPIAPIVLPLSGAVAADSLPRSVAESLDATSTIALVDVDPASPERGRRWPFEVVLRHDRTSVGVESHSMWLLPALPLRPGGRYAVLARRGVTSPEGRSMAAPPLLRGVLHGGGRRLGRLETALRGQLAPALSVAREELAIPWSEDELVFAMIFSVRSLDDLSRDPIAMRADVAAMEGDRIQLDSIERSDDPSRPLAAIVRGRFRSPLWRSPGEVTLARDETGRPRPVATQAIAFSLALPRSAGRRPAPLLMYQHGNPGRAEDEIGAPTQDPFLEAGFAIAGFTDVWNRDPALVGMDPSIAIMAQMLALTTSIRRDARVPDDWIHILGEQLAFVAALRELDSLDVLPFGAPDGRSEIDPEAPLVYEGISQGAIHGQALLAYAPEIRAASLVSGGGRLAELLLHQAADSLLETLPIVFGDLRPVDLWALISLFQVAFDRQDAHLHALGVRPAPSPLRPPSSRPGSPERGPSVLLIAGRGDRFVPNRASRSLAWVLGPLPWLHGPEEPVLGLPRASPPLRGNLADGSTGAYVEFVAPGSGAVPTPGCVRSLALLPDSLLREGHFCAQLAPESIALRVAFLRSARTRAPPVVLDPWTAGPAPIGAGSRESARRPPSP